MRLITFLIAVLSGIAGLGYQITWSRMFAVGLGHEMPSVLAVITAFFAGLALGGWLLDRRIAISQHPARWYVGIEIVIAVWVVVTIGLIPTANQLCFDLLGVDPSTLWHWTVAFLVPLVTLLPATVAMGATLPAMDRFAAPLAADKKMVGGLYGANTFGAVLGTVLSAYWINPWFGYTRSLICFAILNLLCAATVAILFWNRRAVNNDLGSGSEPWPGVEKKDQLDRQLAKPASDVSSDENVNHQHSHPSQRRIAQIAFSTGLLGIGFEVVGVRASSNVFANTVYSYAAIVAVFLMGTAIGGASYQKFGRKREFEQTLAWLLLLLLMALLAGAIAISSAQEFYSFFRHVSGSLPLSELCVAATIFAVPTVLMGAIFSHLAQFARHSEGGVGLILAVNTIGSSTAPILFGMVLVPLVGLKWCLIGLPVGYWLVLAAVDWRTGRIVRLAVGGILILLGAWGVNPTTLRLNPGQALVVEKPGMMASVAVVANTNGKRGLRVSNHFIMGGTQRPQFERIQGLLPLLQHPRPNKVLFLGIGTGITLGAATADPLTQVTGVELVPEIVEVLPYFEPENNSPSTHPRVQLVVADARRYIRTTGERFDVIVGDLYHPGRDGAGSLYTVEHFASIRELLTEDGLACVWVPSYQTDAEVFKMIIRSYLEVFPQGVAYCGLFDNRLMAIALISDNRFSNAARDWFETRNIPEEMLSGLELVDLPDEIGVLGHLVADNETLRTFARSGKSDQLNRDDWPVVTYQAPQYVYDRYPRPWERFMELNQVFASRRNELLIDLAPEQRERLKQYWQARDHYMTAMTLAYSDKTDELLRSLKASDAFPEAYREAVNVAKNMRADRLPKQAITWLKKVIAVRPDGEAAKILLNLIENE